VLSALWLDLVDVLKVRMEDKMSKPDGGPAFPDEGIPGMTLRDWFAGMAMTGMHTNVKLNNDSTGHIALEAYTQADAMIAEREKA